MSGSSARVGATRWGQRERAVTHAKDVADDVKEGARDTMDRE
jgi:hypothetical protein